MTEPNIITKGKKGYGWLPLSDLQFCEDVRDAINRDPDRRAVVKRKGCCCRVVDYSTPIKWKSYHGEHEFNIIIGWKPMEGH